MAQKALTTAELDLPPLHGWPQNVCKALRAVAAMAHYAVTYTRSWSSSSPLECVRLRSKLEQANNELAVLKEVARIKSARLEQIPAHKRPRYAPHDRLAILELRAREGWTVAKTAAQFQLAEETVRIWETRLDAGDDQLFKPPVQVNVFPDFVRLVVQRLKTLCPIMGKKKIAQILARVGLHLATTTVGRRLKDAPTPFNHDSETTPPTAKPLRVVTATRPNHVWHVDLTEVPTTGLWTPWSPFALPQCWPFVWHVAVVVDHFSRACLGFAVFWKAPTSADICGFLERAIRCRGKPKYIISDQGVQFREQYKAWCAAPERQIKPRFGAVHQHGSIAVVERFILSLKDECTRRVRVPLAMSEFREELELYATWYNNFRPHDTLEGRTPVEVFEGRPAGNQLPRFEPRKRWPKDSHCAAPQAPLRPDAHAELRLEVAFLEGRRHLPIVRLRPAA